MIYRLFIIILKFQTFLISILFMYAIITLLLHKLTISAIVLINRIQYDQKQFQRRRDAL